MSQRRVIWEAPKVTSAKAPGHYSSLGEFLKKGEALREEQAQAEAFLAKALPAMVKLLELRFSKGQSLTVMRPLRYRASVLKSSLEDAAEKNFYKSDYEKDDSFVDVVKTVNPGSVLTLKGLDPNLREFIFQDGLGEEHAVSYDDRNALLTQTDIFETVRGYFDGGKLK